MRYLLLLLLLAAPAWADFTATKAAFDAHMIQYGQQHCNHIKEHIYDDGDHLNDVYYDAARVYFQIADYTGVSAWNDCAQASEWIYRDNYIKSAGGNVAGYWNFGRGLRLDYQRTADSQSLTALDQLRDISSWCSGSAYSTQHLPENGTSRENAYCLMTNAEEAVLGRPAPRLEQYRTNAKGHVNQWLTGTPMQPFMAALVAEALIEANEVVPAPETVPYVSNICHTAWASWDSNRKWFNYIGWNGSDDLRDLNLLIAPMYAWAFKQTGDNWYAARFDEIFASGVDGAYLGGGNGKIFNQNYRWSIQGLDWRYSAASPTPTPSPVPTPTPTPKPCGTAATLKNHQCRLDKAGL